MAELIDKMLIGSRSIFEDSSGSAWKWGDWRAAYAGTTKRAKEIQCECYEFQNVIPRKFDM